MDSNPPPINVATTIFLKFIFTTEVVLFYELEISFHEGIEIKNKISLDPSIIELHNRLIVSAAYIRNFVQRTIFRE